MQNTQPSDPSSNQTKLEEAISSKLFIEEQKSFKQQIPTSTKIKKKINIPTDQAVNYIGLIIGPRGSNQKRLEKETGCKIFVRGKGTQKEGIITPQFDDNEQQHVLIIGDTESQIEHATSEIEEILFMNDEERNRICLEQLKIVDQQLTTQDNTCIITVPNNCIGVIIGKGGETIKMLQINSGVKIKIAAMDNATNSYTRNIFVEGDKEAIDKVKKMIENIVGEVQLKLR